MKLSRKAKGPILALIRGDIHDLSDLMDKVERHVLVETLNQADGNIAEAARMLNLQRTTMQSKVRKFKIRLKTVSQ